MGWDAIAKTDKKRMPRKVFRLASKQIIEKAGSVDGGLECRGLDCSPCREMLEKATGVSWYFGEFSVPTVKHLAKIADWNFRVVKEDLWAYWSAKAFLDICAQNNLSIINC